MLLKDLPLFFIIYNLLGLLFFLEYVVLLLEPPSIVDDHHSVGAAQSIASVSPPIVPVQPFFAFQ
jgi:hypothetical protein